MTDVFYVLVKEKFDNPQKKVDWKSVPWKEWKRVLPQYLAEDIERINNNSRETMPYVYDCYIGSAYAYTSLAVRDKVLIEEQAQALREKYIYPHLKQTEKAA